jgi:hypothetical protein
MYKGETAEDTLIWTEHDCVFEGRLVVCCCKWRQTFVLYWYMRTETADKTAARMSSELTLPRNGVYDAVF